MLLLLLERRSHLFIYKFWPIIIYKNMITASISTNSLDKHLIFMNIKVKAFKSSRLMHLGYMCPFIYINIIFFIEIPLLCTYLSFDGGKGG